MVAVVCLTTGNFMTGIAAPLAGNTNDFTDLSLEQLVNIQVTSVSKKEERLDQSPAAIAVITQEDISRMGARSIPEALRMVPGLDVAQIDSSEWAISARGFNSQYANKMLVLVDGRSVYTKGFAGVHWGVQDVVMEDLERIEVIRGPGASLWGANAVNGVINIITKSAKETQGLLVANSVGTEQQPTSTVRYGGQVGTNLFYRVYVKYQNDVGFENTAGQEGLDKWNMLRGGARIDWEPTPENRLTFQGDYYTGDFNQQIKTFSLVPPFSINQEVVNHNWGANVLGRWTHDFSESSQLTLQSYYSREVDWEGAVGGYEDLYDIDLQHRFTLGERQEITWGVGYRYSPDKYVDSSVLTWFPQTTDQQLYSGFLQDDLTLVDKKLHLIVGGKLEHNDFTGLEFQPNGRLLWTPTDRQTLWTSVSRAVRTPSRFERDARYNLQAFPTPGGTPGLVSVFGNPALQSEKLTAYEIGYRIEPTHSLSFDLATFYNVYNELSSFIIGSPTFESNPAPGHILIPQIADNNLSGETYGAELSATWQVKDYWRLMGSYSWLHMHLPGDAFGIAGDSPQNQFKLRSYLDLTHHVSFNSAFYYIDNVPNQKVSAYFSLDAGLTWHPNKNWEFGVWGQNLLEPHTEFSSFRYPVQTEIPRSVYGKVTVRF
jgi:iron complex outermembrane recepter protein